MNNKFYEHELFKRAFSGTNECIIELSELDGTKPFDRSVLDDELRAVFENGFNSYFEDGNDYYGATSLDEITINTIRDDIDEEGSLEDSFLGREIIGYDFVETFREETNHYLSFSFQKKRLGPDSNRYMILWVDKMGTWSECDKSKVCISPENYDSLDDDAYVTMYYKDAVIGIDEQGNTYKLRITYNGNI